MYVVWFVKLFDPQWLLATDLGLTPALKVPIVMVATLFLFSVTKSQHGEWLWGMAAWIVATALNLPFSPNVGDSMILLRQFLSHFLVGLCLIRTIRSPRDAGPIVFMLCVGQFLWWGIFGIAHGEVDWHPDYANFDGYGPLMACGVGPAYFYAMGAKNRWHRRLALIAAGMSVVGVVSAFARGSMLALIVTVFYIGFRSPRKGRTFGLIAVGAVLVVLAGSMINGTTRGEDTKASFFDEMSTMFDQSAGSTGSDRKILWSTATKVFLQHPLIGVGANNFGAVAAATFRVGEIGGQYADNPLRLYGRNLHNIFYQILAEFGLVGVGIFGFLVIRFFRLSRALIRPEATERWRAAGGVDDLRYIALGLEGGMVAFLAAGYFYNTLFYMQLYALLFANALLYSIVYHPDAKTPVRRGTRQFVAGPLQGLR